MHDRDTETTAGPDGNRGIEGSDPFTAVGTHPETAATVAQYDPTDDPPSVTVPELVAHCEDVDPCSLPPLYGRIEPEALDALVGRRPSAGVDVAFRYAGYHVEVGPDALSVTPLD